MGGTQGVCGAVSGMVLVAGAIKSFGIDKLPETNKKASYDFGRELMEKFEERIGTIICKEIKGEAHFSCDACIEEAVKILDEYIGE